MDKVGVAIVFAVAGITAAHWPALAFPSMTVTNGEGQIVAAIFWVGAAILWYMPFKNS